MSRKPPVPLSLAIAAGVLLGVAVSTLWSSDARLPEELATRMVADALLDPVVALPRVEMALVAFEARRAMDSGRPWEAWRLLQQHVDDPDATPGHVLLAARAAAAWGAWDGVQEVLTDRPWLDSVEDGEGRYLLARAAEANDDAAAAITHYSHYASVAGTGAAGPALTRIASLLASRGDAQAAADAFGRAAEALPDVADWLRTLQIEQLAAAGDPLTVSLVSASTPVSAPVRARRVEAEASARLAANDVAGAVRKLEWEERVLRAQDAVAEATRLQLARALILVDNGRTAEARDLLRAIAWDPGALATTREKAADALGELPGTAAADELARAGAYEAAAKPVAAARALRAATAAGAADAGGVQLKLGRLLYEGSDYLAARDAFQSAARQLTDPELIAEATLYAGRALYRSGARSRAAGLAELRGVADRYPGSPAAGTALFLLGDASGSTREALAFYRRAAAVALSPDAREALYRVGDRSLKLDDAAGAMRAWEQYIDRYPRGDATARVAYETGRLHERAGRTAQARSLYEKALVADPVSYYAFRAGTRLGVHPIDHALSVTTPWVGLATDAGAGRAVVERLAALDRLGLQREWQEELASALRVLDGRPAALIIVAEGLRDAGHVVEAIRLGRQILPMREGNWDARLLRVVFPLPYRELIEHEAERAGVDPMLLAGLVRQESSFRPDARSWVGATGLSQIMPATGQWLASSLRIAGYEPRLLEVPEVNLYMGARYLGDQLRSFGGSRDLALAAYNAGPGRASRWRRELGHGRDTDAFREAIPFTETREYVKIVLRNAALYSRLYDNGGSVSPLLADDL